MNKRTVALTRGQYKTIIITLRSGGAGFRSNERIAAALMVEASLGLRIGDILKLSLCDIVQDGERLRLNICEQKTSKRRAFTVPLYVYQFLENYCMKNGIERTDIIFPFSVRAVQKALKTVCDYLGYENISTHSFRKFFATEIYNSNNYDIVLVQQLLQHCNTSVTQRYIGIQPQQIERALIGHNALL